MASVPCDHCGAPSTTATVTVTSASSVPEKRAHYCEECFAREDPEGAARMWRDLVALRRAKFARPIDLDAVATRLRQYDGRATSNELAPLAEQLVEHFALNGQTPPEEVRAFIARHRPTPAAEPRPRVRFTSPLFASDGELAPWLRRRLFSRGLYPSPPIAEDWGWIVEVDHSGATVMVGCGAVVDAPGRWLLWFEQPPPRRGLLDALLRRHRASPPALGAVVAAVDAILRLEPAVSDVEWFRVDAHERELDHAPRPDTPPARDGG